MSIEDLFSSLEKQSSFVSRYKDKMYNEEHTKLGFIIPFLKSLGYNVHCPDEVITEYSCDFGTKKGEKVDFVVMKDKQPYILVEAKHCDKSLNERFASQLSRYFNQTDAKLGILTNGIQYWFYSDFDKVNVMDTEPFFRFNILDFDMVDVENIHKFTKEVFLTDASVLSSWRLNELVSLYYNWLEGQIQNPTRDFLQLFCSTLSQKVDIGDFKEVLLKHRETSLVDRIDSILEDEDYLLYDEDESYEIHRNISVDTSSMSQPDTKKPTSRVERNKTRLEVITSTSDTLYRDFRRGYLRDDIVEVEGKRDHFYVPENDASYIIKYDGVTFDFLCAKDSARVNVTYKNIYGVLIGDTVYRLYAWSSLIATVLEALYGMGGTKHEIIGTDREFSIGSRLLFDSGEYKSFVAKAMYKGICFEKRLSAVASIRRFLDLLQLFKLDVSSIFIIMYDFDKSVPGKNTKAVDAVNRIVDAHDIVVE